MVDKLDVTVDLKKEIFGALTETVSPFIMINKSTKKIELKGTVKGTVFSGHPTRTTWGNTLRVLSYIKYLMRNSNKEYECFVSGDDATMIIEREDLDYTITAIHRAYCFGSVGFHGLG